MKVLRKMIAGTGVVLVGLGVASIDSPSMLFPVAMIAAGAVIAGVSARWEEKWTEE